MYENLPIELALASGNRVPDNEVLKALERFENFYSDVCLELANFGEIEDILVANNLVEHLLGNVWLRFKHEEDAIKCMDAIRYRHYDGKLLVPEYSPVHDFE